MTSQDLVSCRTVLWWMVFTGVAVNFMLRVQMNLVIVAVVKPPEIHQISSECHGDSLNATNFWTNSSNSHEYSPTTRNKQVFTWNEYEQGLAIGAYYWLHWLSEIPGGVLAKKYGTKLMFGLGNLLAVILGFFLPLAMYHSLSTLIAIRIVQGFVAGVAYPSMHAMAAKWIPRSERSKFVSAYSGSSIGIGLTYPMCGFIIDYMGWEAVFYVTSALGVIWYLFWIFCVYDDPGQHPRISADEKKYILDNLGTSVDHCYSASVPWRAILTSWPVWISIMSNWSICWGFYTLITEAPAYFSFIHGWSINQTGIVAGLPHIITMIYGWSYAMLCDWLLRTKRLTLTNIRKIATASCTAGPALMVVGLAFSGCHPLTATALNMVGLVLMGSMTSGPLSNLVDLSPNYASVLLGICGLVVDVAGFLSPIIVGLLINNNQTLEQWRLVFLITALNMTVGCVGFCLWGTAVQQPWNSHQMVDDELKMATELENKKDEEIPLAQ